MAKELSPQVHSACGELYQPSSRLYALTSLGTKDAAAMAPARKNAMVRFLLWKNVWIFFIITSYAF
ncbi:hypothetical protein D7X87_25240 [bacterium D16-54]|nr:hypothetical protein D7X87_25240 [bacterium D16-54]RKJ09450.1 hypothetical protein D7X65_25335 [bacterium D16-56]